jgi:hypothetical protein
MTPHPKLQERREMTDPITTNLADFGFRELRIVRDLLTAMLEQGLPPDFDSEGVVPCMNRNSGYVFLTNAEYQVAMLNGDKLESFYSSPYEGREGFKDGLVEQFDSMHPEDQQWMMDAGLVEALGETE